MTPVIVSGTQLTQTITPLSGGRAKITVTFTNNGGTAYAPVVTATIPAGSTFDSTGAVTYTSTNASITGVAQTGTAPSPIFTFTGPGTKLIRYSETASVSYYVRPTVFDTQFATSFTTAGGSNLDSAETTLDPTAPSTANISAKLAYTDSCGNAASQTNSTSYDPLTPDLDITATAPTNTLITNTTAANYDFTISNSGDAGSLADNITADFPGFGSSWTITSIRVFSAAAGTGGTAATVGANAALSGGIWTFSPAQLGTLGTGGSIVIRAVLAYSGTPGPLALKLRVTGESRAQDGTTVTGNYSLDQRAQRIVGTTLTKVLQGTSETLTTGANVLIGEQATYRIRANFFGVEDDITGLVINDTPADSNAPAGGHLGLSYVSHVLTGSNQIIPSSVTVNGAAPSPVAVPASLAQARIAFNFATNPLTAAVVNAGTSLFESDVTVRVLNIAANTDNKALRNNVGLGFTYLGNVFRSSDADDNFAGGTSTASLHAQTDVNVRRPAPVIVKTARNVTRASAFVAANTPTQAGDIIEYKIVITNPVAAERPLFDLTVTDILPAKVNLSASNVGADTDGNLTTIEVANTAGTSGLGATLVFNQTNTPLPTVGSNFTRLDPGQTITLLYRGATDASVTPTEVLSNTASVRGYSLALPSGSQTAPLGTENTATGPTRYNIVATAATLLVDNISQVKSIVSTSDPASADPSVFVGEQIRYRLTVQLPQGTIPDLVVKDVLPAGLSLIAAPVVTIGSSISSSTQPTITPSSLPSAGGATAQWAFGARTVANDIVVANRTITIDYIAQVRNDSATVAGTLLANSASYSYTGTGGTFTAVPSVTVTVQAPAVGVTRGVRNVTRAQAAFVTSVVSGDVNSPDAGDVMEYQIVITNPTAANVSSAFDFNIADTVPTGMTYVANSASISAATGVTGPGVGALAPDVSGQVLTWGRTQAAPVNIDLAPNGNLTLLYRVTVDDTAKPLQVYTNAVIVDWTSLDGNPAVNPILAPDNIALLAPGNALGERNGNGTSPNSFRATNNVVINALNSTTIAKVKNTNTLPIDANPNPLYAGHRIGDLITYTVTATLQEGTLNPFIISDVLPAGLAYVATTSITPTPAGITFTVPVAGSTAPSPGATGTLTWNFSSLLNPGNNVTTPPDTLVLVYTARILDAGGTALPPTPVSVSRVNSATVSYQEADTTVFTSAPVTAPLDVRQPLLTLTKVIATPAVDSLGNYVIRPGQTGSFTLTASNATGTAPAYNLKLTDTIPAGMRGTAPVLTAATLNGVNVLATLTAASWDNTTGAYVFDLSDTETLLPGQTLILTYTATVDAGATIGATLTNTATLNQFFSKPASDLPERRQYAAVGPATTSIIVGLEITGSVYNDADVSNSKNGLEDWSGTTKPTVYANLVTTGGSPAVFRTVTIAPGTGTFTFTNVPPGTYNIVVASSAAGLTASRPINWLFQSPTNGTINAVLTNTDLANQDLGLSQGSYATPLITKSKSGDTLPTASPSSGFRIGDIVTYTLNLNPQEGALTGFAVTDALPAGLAFISTSSIAVVAPTGARYTYATPSGGNAPAANATGTLTWTFGNFTNALAGPVTNSTPSAIAANNTLRIIYTARVINTGTGNLAVPGVAPAATTTTLSNAAVLVYNNPAPISAAASAGPATANIDVAQPRLTLAKTRLAPVANNLVRPGDTAQFRLTLANDGTAPAYNVSVKDVIPSGMRGTSPVLNAATLNGTNILSTLNAPGWVSATGAWTLSLVDAQFNVSGQIEYILPGQTLVLDYTVTVDTGATKGATLNNSATIEAYYSKPDTDLTQRRQYSLVGPATQPIVVSLAIDGFVYDDLTPNGIKDSFENWSTGAPVYVNLVDVGSGLVIASDAVGVGAGAYNFTNLAPGNYRLVVTNAASNSTAAAPASWLFRSPPTGSLLITLSNADLAAQNFGLFRGRTLTGRVFRDTGNGGGTANDGLLNGTESGIGNVTVRLLSAGLSELALARTDGAGNFILSIPASTSVGATLIVEETNPPVYVSTGAYAGNTGGTYNRTTDRLTFTYADSDYAGVLFGDIPEDSLVTDGAQFIVSGAIAFYRHTYTAGTAGTVTFALTAAADPIVPWTQILVRDLNCNGQIDAGEPIVNGVPLVVAAGEEICLVVKESSSSGAPTGARDTISITSTFSAVNASPALTFNRLRHDVTTVGTASAAGLQLVKAVDKTTASPGEIITYTITYTNVGAESVSVFFIDDRTPAYTTFVSAAAGPFPLNLTAVAITAPAVGAAGTLRWDFTGTLAPGSTGTVTFQVKVEQ